MVVEIIAGLVFGSMALLADGVHMATHVGALGLAAWAYWMARRHAKNRRFTFGSGKFGDLAGFASALDPRRHRNRRRRRIGRCGSMRPVPIQYLEAIIVAALGLGVNIVSAVMLHDDDTITTMKTKPATTTTTICAPPMSMCWRTPRPRCSRLRRSVSAPTSAGARSIRWSEFSARSSSHAGRSSCCRQTGLVLLDVEDDPELADDIRKTLEDELRAFRWPICISGGSGPDIAA